MEDKKTSERSVSAGEIFVPLMEEIHKHSFLTNFEATCVLTTCPKYCIRVDNLSSLDGKPYFIVPSETFYLRDQSKEFKNIFDAINDDINSESFNGIWMPISKNVDYLIKPSDLIMWAIRHNFSLPLNLQKALSIEITKPGKLESWRGMVNNMIVAQYTQLSEKETSPKKILGSPMMRTYVPDSNSKSENVLRRLKRDISRISKKRKPGWQEINDNETQDRLEPIKIIPEVLEEALGEGGIYWKVNFALLREVIITAVFIKIHELEGVRKIRKMRLAEFMLLMIRDTVINRYLKESPSFIVYFIEITIKEIHELLPEIFPVVIK